MEAYPHNANLLCVEDIAEPEIIDNLKLMGWKSPKDVDGCSSNCQLNTFNNMIHEKSYGYSPYELELSQLIRKGSLTREQALEKIKDQRTEMLGPIMKRLDIQPDDLNNLPGVN